MPGRGKWPSSQRRGSDGNRPWRFGYDWLAYRNRAVTSMIEKIKALHIAAGVEWTDQDGTDWAHIADDLIEAGAMKGKEDW